ncbi:hypothetical protein SAMN04515679_0722 [Pelosinus fermentans]|uniref:Uncharacterized protein n=1 Tax=Pelosinus fermentans B4 TaxID=1149862 RepID=I8RAH8_9FIRM|nr:hypothetical protein FB4_1592 [Pelosinus fermentans B4]EIW27391.1 hypothetical protein FA11_1410 [Pelosinus fermentans A11]OAM92652.1 hypothetical protein FR7_00668 [Pelosinus fermentans DSM 17108]SDQ52340.1 hypothetical protein SAMN04515679_0722 [Pelosinus fermentans]
MIRKRGAFCKTKQLTAKGAKYYKGREGVFNFPLRALRVRVSGFASSRFNRSFLLNDQYRYFRVGYQFVGDAA